MKNKKIVVFLLIAVLVLGMTLTALVGCKDYKDVDYEKMSEFLATAIENTAENKKINNMNLGATMTIDTTYGDSKKTYTIDIAAALSLKDDSNYNNASLEIKEGDKNIVSAYYFEDSGKDVYLRLGESGRFRLNGIKVKEILKKNKSEMITDDESTEITSNTVDGITGFLDTLAIITDFEGVKTQVSKKGTAYRLEITLGNLLNGLLNNAEDDSISGLVGNILTELNLELDASTLASVLPNITVGININVSNKKASKAVITGVSADLSCDSKEVKIARKNNGGNLLELNISKNFTAKADIALKFGDDVKIKTDDWNAYPAKGIGAINLTAKGSFELKQDITNISLFNLLNVNIPADTYNLELGISADPAKLVDMDFTGIHSLPHAIDKAIDAVNSALDYLNIKVTTKEGAPFLQIELTKNDVGNVTIGDLKLDALGIDSSSGLGSLLGRAKGMTLKNLWSGLSGLGIFTIPNNLDAGYAYKNGKDYTGGYTVDTANGYVDANKDDEPDKDDKGNFIVADGYDLHKGIAVKKEECGYILKDGNWVVDVENGYVKDGKKEVVKKEENGDFKVASGFVLYKGKKDKWAKPMKKEDYNALPDTEKPAESTGMIPDTVKDLINNLSIVAKDGKISVQLSGMSFVLNEDFPDTKATLSATISLDKTGINVTVGVTGLEEVKIDNVPVGLPELIEAVINIKFTDIKYGAIK